MAVKLHRKETTTLPELAWVSNTPNLCSYLVLTSPLFWTFLNSTYIWNRAVQPWGTLDYRWFHMDHLYMGGFSSTPCLIFHPFSVLPWISQFCCWVNSAIKSHETGGLACHILGFQPFQTQLSHFTSEKPPRRSALSWQRSLWRSDLMGLKIWRSQKELEKCSKPRLVDN